MIKRQYLGAEKVKKRVAPASERMKFVFDWKASEDTSRDLNPLYDKPAEVSILFGRGLLAGTDRREQKVRVDIGGEEEKFREISKMKMVEYFVSLDKFLFFFIASASFRCENLTNFQQILPHFFSHDSFPRYRNRTSATSACCSSARRRRLATRRCASRRSWRPCGRAGHAIQARAASTPPSGIWTCTGRRNAWRI